MVEKDGAWKKIEFDDLFFENPNKISQMESDRIFVKGYDKKFFIYFKDI